MVGTFNWQSIYNQTNSTAPATHTRPVIGITGNYNDQTCTLAEGYYRSVLLAGGIPIVIPPYMETECLSDQLAGLDGLIFSGGGDLNPLFFDEEPVKELHSINAKRDRQELLLAKLAYDRQIPTLGICRGIQVLATALGGKVYQDIYTQSEGAKIKHSQDLDRGVASHTVSVAGDSMLCSIFGGQTTLAVNSFHHQAVKSVPDGFKTCAVSKDGIIEAMESTEFKSVIGVQWHPECFCMNDDQSMRPLFEWLVREARSFKKAKSLHSHILSLDSHCDTPMFFDQGINFASRDPKILVDLHKMAEGHLDASIMVAYLKQEGRDEASLSAATTKANHILSEIEKMIEANKDYVSLAYTPEDLYRNKRAGKRSIMLGIENGYAIGRDLENIDRFRKRGVVYMTLCHNGDNDICDSAKGNGEHDGISEFGEKVIKEMNRVGMMVDLSHGGEKSFYDAIEISRKPIVCSHSSSRLLCDHPRNLTDDQMKKLAKTGGVAQVTFYNGFLRTDGKATINDAIQHLNHMVDVMGIEHVGIGTDFDGDGGVPGLASASELINFTRRLLAERYSDNYIELIWGKNFLRVMTEVQNI